MLPPKKDLSGLVAEVADHADHCCAVEEILDEYAQDYLSEMPYEDYQRLVRALALLIMVGEP